MKVQTFSFTAGGWSAEPDGALDSERTLVVLFGASNLIDRPAPVQRVIDALFMPAFAFESWPRPASR